MTEATPALVDGTTGEAPSGRDTGVSQVISGPTHQSSDGAAPDPTGLRGTLHKNFAAAAEKASAESNAKREKPAETTTQASTEGARGADGKFLPKDAAKPDADEPPSTWRTETKALWKEIDVKFGPESGKLLKEELRKRENDFRKGIADKDTEVAAIKGFHGELSPVIAKHEYLWKDQGITATKAVEHLMNLNANFRRDPAGTIKWLAQSAGLDLTKLAGGQAQAGGQTADPQAQTLQLVNGLRSELHEIKTSWASQTTAAAAAEIQNVIDEKGADGQLLRPHFNDVFQDIQAEIQLLHRDHPDWSPRQTAIKAYETAVWRNEGTRPKMIDGISAQKRASEDAEQRARAAEVAAKNVRGGPPNNLNGVPSTDLRGMLTARVNAMQAGGSRL